MITISKEEISENYLLQLSADKHALKAKLDVFEKKYKKSFETFEKVLPKNKENFEEWDDYLEWKAYVKTEAELSVKIKAVQNEDFQVA